MFSEIILNSNMFIHNKYTKIYLSLLEFVKNRKLEENVYYERHHALPKCLYAEYSNLSEYSWNCVVVTGREHFVLHKLLTKMVDKNSDNYYKLMSAFGAMSRIKSRNISSRQYAECRKAHSIAMSYNRKGKTYEEIYGEETAKIMRKKRSIEQSKLNIGRKHNISSKIKNAASNKETRALMTTEEKLRISAAISTANKGKQKPNGFSENVSKIQKGREKSLEEKKKLGEASRGTIFINKNGVNTKIKKEFLAEYLDNGWKTGMLIKNKKGNFL